MIGIVKATDEQRPLNNSLICHSGPRI